MVRQFADFESTLRLAARLLFSLLSISTNSCTGGRSSTEKGDKVRFRVCDVFLPEADEVRASWAEAAEVEGTVVDFSDCGSASRVLAVIEVVQRHAVVVPVAKLKRSCNEA